MTQHAAPLVSVVMPAHDAAPFVGEAIESVRRQRWPRIELVVIDDGSRDGTAQAVEAEARRWGGPGRDLVLIRQQNAGAAAARNAGVARSRGAFVALLDADDRYAPTMIPRLVSALEADPRARLAFAMYRYVDSAGRVRGVQAPPAPGGLTPAGLLAGNLVHAPLMRREAWDVAGPLDARLRAHIDLDFFVRLARACPGAIVAVPEPLSDYRRRDGQITQDWRRMRRAWARVHLKLRREGFRLAPAERRRARAGLALYWGTLAYEAGAHAEARRLVAAAWRTDPLHLARDGHARVRAAACLATLLPGGVHDRLRRWHNARAGAKAA